MMSNISYDASEHGPKAAAKYAMSLFTSDEFIKFWPQIEEMLDTVPHTWRHWTKDELYLAVESGKIQAWGIGPPQTVVLLFLTSVHVFPAIRVLTVLWAAGMFEDEMAPLLDATFNDYAKLNNCAEIEVRGRLGWKPHLKKAGYRHEADVWTRQVHYTRMN